MAKISSPRTPSANRLLNRLSDEEYHRILPALQSFPMKLKHILYRPGDPIDHVYFPLDGVVSMVTLMENGTGSEVGRSTVLI